MISAKQIGSNIANLRKQSNMTQQDLASILFVTHQAISKWEQGKSIPSLDILYAITKQFSITIDSLLENATITDDNYKDQLRKGNRDAIITQLINSNTLLTEYFYLLQEKERNRVLKTFLETNKDNQIMDCFHILSHTERLYVLHILTQKPQISIASISSLLSQEERSYYHNHKKK
jgi:transcriptional regulator with XRE-family HTH domain